MQNESPDLYDRSVAIIRSCKTYQHIEGARTFINHIEDEQIKNHLNYLCDRQLESVTSEFVDTEEFLAMRWNSLHPELPIVGDAPSQEVITELILITGKFDIQQFSKAVSDYSLLKLAVYRSFKHLLMDYYASQLGFDWDEENSCWITLNSDVDSNK